MPKKNYYTPENLDETNDKLDAIILGVTAMKQENYCMKVTIKEQDMLIANMKQDLSESSATIRRQGTEIEMLQEALQKIYSLASRHAILEE